MNSNLKRNPFSVIRRTVWIAVSLMRRVTNLTALQVATALFAVGAALLAGEVISGVAALLTGGGTFGMYTPLAVAMLAVVPMRYRVDMESARRRSQRNNSGGAVTIDPASERAVAFSELSAAVMFAGVFLRAYSGDVPMMQVGWVFVMAASIATYDDRPGGRTVWAAIAEKLRTLTATPATVPA